MKGPEQLSSEETTESTIGRLRAAGIEVRKAKEFPPRGECMWSREFCNEVAKWIVDGDRYCARHTESVADIILSSKE